MDQQWGNINLVKIENNDFWILMDELYDDASEFIHSRTTILNAFKLGNLFGLRISENDFMFQNNIIQNSIFANDYIHGNSFYLLPCICIKENDTAILIWTHTRARNKGLAKKLLQLLNIKYVYKPFTSSIEFWNRCNVKSLY